ncbi:hypothetical protein AGLY_008210 [Aphis glycines]|uniref:Uncharacterized protein n=1 Tax=Aphis glycines TaxID=307491 RepID=A0A6G0TLD8_APHGL|nr:hypothetical protein AGLY_008210 [Aphis glycines]
MRFLIIQIFTKSVEIAKICNVTITIYPQTVLNICYYSKSISRRYLKITPLKNHLSFWVKKFNTKFSISFLSNNYRANSKRHYRKNIFENFTSYLDWDFLHMINFQNISFILISNFYETCQNCENLQLKHLTRNFPISLPSNNYKENSSITIEKNVFEILVCSSFFFFFVNVDKIFLYIDTSFFLLVFEILILTKFIKIMNICKLCCS